MEDFNVRVICTPMRWSNWYLVDSLPISKYRYIVYVFIEIQHKHPIRTTRQERDHFIGHQRWYEATCLCNNNLTPFWGICARFLQKLVLLSKWRQFGTVRQYKWGFLFKNRWQCQRGLPWWYDVVSKVSWNVVMANCAEWLRKYIFVMTNGVLCFTFHLDVEHKYTAFCRIFSGYNKYFVWSKKKKKVHTVRYHLEKEIKRAHLTTNTLKIINMFIICSLYETMSTQNIPILSLIELGWSYRIIPQYEDTH